MCYIRIMTTHLRDIFNEWQNNLAFREEFKKDPIAALQHAGFEASPADLEKIQAMLKHDASTNEKLDDRINK